MTVHKDVLTNKAYEGENESEPFALWQVDTYKHARRDEAGTNLCLCVFRELLLLIYIDGEKVNTSSLIKTSEISDLSLNSMKVFHKRDIKIKTCIWFCSLPSLVSYQCLLKIYGRAILVLFLL